MFLKSISDFVAKNKNYKKAGSLLQSGAIVGGQLLSDYAIDEVPNVGQAALGGFASGFATAGPIGGIIGGIGSAFAAGNKSAQESQREKDETLYRMYNSMVNGDVQRFMNGGAALGENGMMFIPIQTAEGEMMFTPGGSLSETDSEKEHSEMGKKKVTDFVPSETLIYSNKLKINYKDLELVVGRQYGEDPNSYQYKEVKLKDILGKKPLSFAQAVMKVKKMYKVMDSDNNKSTYSDNESSRNFMLETLYHLQESKKTTKIPKMGTDIPEYDLGGPVNPLSKEELEKLIGTYGGGQALGMYGFPKVNGEVIERMPIPTIDPTSVSSSSPTTLPSKYAAEASPYDSINKLIDGRIADVGATTDNSKMQYEQLFGRLKTNNRNGFLSSLAGNLGQSTKVEAPVKIRNFHTNGITAYEMNRNAQSVSAPAYEAAKAMAGGSSSVVAPIMIARAMAQAGDMNAKAMQYNKSQKDVYNKNVVDTINYNQASRASAENKETDFANRKGHLLGETYSNYMGSKSAIDANETSIGLSIEKDRVANLNALADKKMLIQINMLQNKNDLASQEKLVETQKAYFESLKGRASESQLANLEYQIEQREKQIEALKKMNKK